MSCQVGLCARRSQLDRNARPMFPMPKTAIRMWAAYGHHTTVSNDGGSHLANRREDPYASHQPRNHLGTHKSFRGFGAVTQAAYRGFT